MQLSARSLKSLRTEEPVWCRYCPDDQQFGWDNSQQYSFLRLICPDAFYGGAGGGGKSWALCYAALQYCDQPGYNALLLRRTFPMLEQPEGIIPTLREWLQGVEGATWSEAKRIWTFETGGRPATLKIGHLEDERALTLYQGGAYHYIGMDEGTQYEEHMLRYMFSRLRQRTGDGIPLRLRVTSNPGGKGHNLIKARYITDHGVWDRVTIRAALSDNLYLNEKTYSRSLDELDDITKRQIKSGDWTAMKLGAVFDRKNFKMFEEMPGERGKSVRYWDLAATAQSGGNDPDYTSGTRITRLKQDRDHNPPVDFIVEHNVSMRKSPADVDVVRKDIAKQDGYGTMVVEEQEPGASGVRAIDQAKKLFEGYMFKADKKSVAKDVRHRMWSTAVGNGKVGILAGEWNNRWLDEHEAVPDGVHDDDVDSASGAYHMLTSTRGYLDYMDARLAEQEAERTAR